MTSPLRSYQTDAAIEAAQTIQRSGGYYIQHPPGAGKSLTAIAVARLLKAERIVVVCPLVAIGVWHREFAKWWPDRSFRPTVINYDKLLDNATLQRLCSECPDLLIVDEAQYVKSPSAARTRAIWKLREYSAGVLYLSGTPAHSPVDWWAQYKVIAPGEPIFRANFSAFKNSLLVLGGPNGNWPMKDKKTGQLRIRKPMYDSVMRAIAPYTHVAPNALDDLEEPVDQEIPFELDAKEIAALADMEKDLRIELPPSAPVTAEIVLTKMMRLTQIAAGHATADDGSTVEIGHSRERALADLLEQHDSERVVIACRFREDIQRIKVLLQAAGRPCSIIDGGTSGPERTKSEDWFQKESPDNAVMILQYQAGGVAITLTAAKIMVLYTLDLSVIRYRQMIGRIWRIGQKGRCVIYTLCADGTQDSLALKGLKHGYDAVNLAKILTSRLYDGAA